MPIRYPIEYELTPREIKPGMHWLTLKVKNIGDEPLTALDVRLNSFDTYSIRVTEPSTYVAKLRPGEEEVRAFQVTADMTGRVYASIDAHQEGEAFHWETPGILVTVGEEVAELVNVFAVTAPYPPPGEKIRCESIVRGLDESEGLMLEFWVQPPEGEFEQLTALKTNELQPGEEEIYPVEFSPEMEGSYTVHAYLYDGVRRIGHEMDYVYVIEA